MQTLRTSVAPMLVSALSHPCSHLHIVTVQHMGGARPRICWQQAMPLGQKVGSMCCANLYDSGPLEALSDLQRQITSLPYLAAQVHVRCLC